jgi:hypothetical protein
MIKRVIKPFTKFVGFFSCDGLAQLMLPPSLLGEHAAVALPFRRTIGARGTSRGQCDKND